MQSTVKQPVEDTTDRISRNVDNVTIHQRCETPQKSPDLVSTAANSEITQTCFVSKSSSFIVYTFTHEFEHNGFLNRFYNRDLLLKI